MWHAINNEHAEQFGPFARCTVERLMHIAGIDGLRRKRKKPKTRSADPESCPMDMVDRQFTAQAPCKLWVANITYVPIQAGWVYAMFILDVFTRDIVGWQVINHMRESLARDALMIALARKYRVGKDVTGLVHHSDRGVQFRSIRYGQALAESTVITSVGSRGIRTIAPWLRPPRGLAGITPDLAMVSWVANQMMVLYASTCMEPGRRMRSSPAPYPYAARLLVATSSVHNIEHRLWPTGTPGTPRPGNCVPMQRFSA